MLGCISGARALSLWEERSGLGAHKNKREKELGIVSVVHSLLFVTTFRDRRQTRCSWRRERFGITAQGAEFVNANGVFDVTLRRRSVPFLVGE